MCRFCRKAAASAAESDNIYSSFLSGLEDGGLASSGPEEYTPESVGQGPQIAMPGTAAWKAKRASTAAAVRASKFSRADKREAEMCATLRKRRVPTVILTGFLGSGKTTLLNRLLDITQLRLAVIENEVGAVSVDDKLIKSGTTVGDNENEGGGAEKEETGKLDPTLFQPSAARAQEVILLPNGCMCCRVRGDLRDTPSSTERGELAARCKPRLRLTSNRGLSYDSE